GRVPRPRAGRAVALAPHRAPAAALERQRVLARVVGPDGPDLVRRGLELDEAPGTGERLGGRVARRRPAAAAGQRQERARGECERPRAVQPGDATHRDSTRSQRLPYRSLNTATVPYSASRGGRTNSTPRSTSLR